MSVMLIFNLFVAVTSLLGYVSYCLKSIQANVFVLLSSWLFFIFFYVLNSSMGPFPLISEARELLVGADFYSLVVDGMLGYILFAGCLHVDISSFIKYAKVIVTLSVVTTLISFFLTAYLIHFFMSVFSIPHNIVSCFLYAAVIAPTDPVAVLALLKNLKLPKELYTKIASESLLNDGVGVVLFVTVLNFANVSEFNTKVLGEIILFFMYEGVLGLLFGVIIAYIVLNVSGFGSENKIGNQDIFLLLALLNFGYVLAKFLHMSPPLVAVGSGLYSSYLLQGLREGAKNLIHVFWDTIDEILNYSLFFIVGFQVIFINPSSTNFLLMFFAILVNFIVRLVSVCAPLLAIRIGYAQNTTLYKTLVIGGLKGGLSLALSLSIPRSFPGFDVVYDMTYAVVAFTVIIQGLSIERYLKLIKSKTTLDEVVL